MCTNRNKHRFVVKFERDLSITAFKVVVRAENLPREFLQTLGNYYLSVTMSKIQRLKKISPLKNFVNI